MLGDVEADGPLAPGAILRSPTGHTSVVEMPGEWTLRLGEGTGAALAFSLLDAALRIPREMATFDSAGVSGPTSEIQPEA